MNRSSSRWLALALSLTVTGCVSKAFPLLSPVGTSNPTETATPAKAPILGTLRVRVSWPKKYFSNTIPYSTNAFELFVMDTNGGIAGQTVLTQGTTLAELKLMPGNNYALKVFAYRNYGTANQELIAQAYTPGLNIQPAKLTAAPVSLCPVFVPYLASLDYNVAKRNDMITITGNNFGTPPVIADFIGATQSVNLLSSTSISVQLPNTAFTGNLSVTADGVKSENSAFLWVLDSLTASASTYSIPIGQSLPLAASPSYFVSDPIPAGVQEPLVSWESADPGIASFNELGLLTGITTGTTTVHAKLGKWTSNDLTITVTPPPPPPTISRFSRSDGMEVAVARPGDPVCLEGTGFSGNILVDFNGATTSVTATESTKLWVQVPANANTGFVKAAAGGAAGTSPKPLWILNANPVLTLAGKEAWDPAGASEAHLLYGMSLPLSISANWTFKPGESEANYLPIPTPAAHSGYLGVGCHFINDTTTATMSALNQSGDVYAWVQYPEAVIRSSNQLLFHIIPSWVETFVGNYCYYSDGIGTGALLMLPKGLSCYGGTLYLTDQYRIRKIDIATRQVSTLAGSSVQGGSDGNGVAASFKDPYGMAINSNGDVFIADQGNNNLRQLSPSGQVTSYPAAGTTFNYPTGLAFGPAGIYVSEMGYRRIRVINASGSIFTLAGNGGTGSVDGAATIASFADPTGLTISADGNIYVTDHQSIRKIDSAGNVSTLAGGASTGFMDGAGNVAAFNCPRAIAIGPDNNLYVADYLNNAIRKIDSAGNVTTVAGNQFAGIADGPGTGGNFMQPNGLAFGPDGALYVADRFNYRIRRIILPK